MWKNILLLFICLFAVQAFNHAFAQVDISGTISDQQSDEPIPFVSVVIYQFQSSKIVDYTQSDQEGNFLLSIPAKKSVYTLKTSRLGYQKSEQSIIVASDAVRQLTVPIKLIQDTTNLKEVVIEGPIIVKEDTTIYDVAHFTTARSKSLEDVLSNIPGFKISPDGTIQVDGKVVDKVIVDGKEVSGAGGSVLTKALSPENVESVEVRFDEKDDKLKNSLLDSKKFVVLDIKLKEDLNKSLFGRAKLTTGYRRQPEYGGYSNLFSLTKTNNLQLFAEHDRFGFETIPLKSIKNIGADAYNLLFDLPADFESLTEKEDYDNQVFGFPDYTRAEKSILGISDFIHFNNQWSLYIGSYSNLTNDGQRRNYQQGFNNS
ncbi:MAG: carboxypeptidase-like regulatory domain-containing protein, partial [Bacteroidota bacterium]